jgi:hypothetical protein
MAFGSLFEENRVLGSKGEGAFAFGNGTTTFYSGMGGKLALDTSTTLRATGYVGYTSPSLNDNSLIKNASDIITTAFNANIERRSVGRDDDSLRFGVSQPLRVESGSLNFAIPVARSSTTNDVYTSNFVQDLSAKGREVDLELNYAFPLQGNANISAGALYRMDAGHQDGKSDALGVMRWNKKF